MVNLTIFNAAVDIAVEVGGHSLDPAVVNRMIITKINPDKLQIIWPSSI